MVRKLITSSALCSWHCPDERWRTRWDMTYGGQQYVTRHRARTLQTCTR